MSTATDTSTREIVATRVFDAPRETVFRLWTDPEHIKHWWGPRGFTNTIHEMDVRPGGVWRFVMHGPDGVDYDNEIVYGEIDAPALLTYTHVAEPNFDVRVTFDEAGDQTRVTVQMTFETAEERQRVVDKFGAVEGLHQTLERLGEQIDRISTFTISRVFDAPRDLVFKAWTERDHLVHWWGPKGLTMVHLTNDLRPGGVMHYGMRGPGGHMMWGKWVYREIAPDDRLSFVVSFSDEQGGTVRAPFSSQWPLETLSTITFTSVEGSKTLVSMDAIPVNATEAERDMFRGFTASMQGGWKGTLDQLEAHLAGTARES
jgi:uncharacterized protein YndB with AHSA1/START domain